MVYAIGIINYMHILYIVHVYSVLNATGVYARLAKILQHSLKLLRANAADAKHEKKERIQHQKFNRCKILLDFKYS